MSTKATIRFETKIETPTEREKVLMDTLKTLPEVHVPDIDGWTDLCAACDHLAAAELEVAKAQKSLHEASARIRAYVAHNWHPSEINRTVRDMLMVW